MTDPIAIGIVSILFIAALVFLYFARQGEDESNFEKAYDEAALRLLSEQKEKKVTKTKTNKNKKDKKNEKKDDKADDVVVVVKEEAKENAPPLVAEAAPATHPEKKQPEHVKPKENAKAKENQVVSEDSKVEVFTTTEPSVPVSTPVPEPVSEEKKSNKKNKHQKKDKEKEIVEEVVLEAKPAPAVQAEVPREKSKKPKQKKRGPVPHDLDQHKVLGRLANIEEIEPEYIDFISQYFMDTADRETALSNNVLALEKTTSDLRQKAEQHCAARMIAEKEVQNNQRALNELNKRVVQLETAEKSDQSLIHQLKTQLAEVPLFSSEIDQAKIETQASIDALTIAKEDIHNLVKLKGKMLDDLDHARNEIKALSKKLADNDVQLNARKYELDETRKEYSEIEVVVRSLKTDLEAKNQEILVKAADVSGEKTAAITERDTAVKDLKEKEKHFNERETALMAENKRLDTLVKELQKEIVKFEQFKLEQTALQAKLEQRENELDEKTKLIQQQEIVVSNEEALKAENASLKNQVADLTAQLEKANQETHEAIAKAAEALSAANDEVVVLKNAVTLDAATSSSDEVEKLKKENKYLNDKNEELRNRNFKILDDVTALEKRILINNNNQQQAGPANPAPTEKKNIDDHSTVLDEERTLVVSTLQALADLPKLPKKVDTKNYASWLKDVSSVLKKKISEAESSSQNENSEDVELYKTALETLKSEISNIESAWSCQASAYEKKIAGLEQKLNKTQISSLKESLSPVTSPASSPVIQKENSDTRKGVISDSGDSDEWEVVN